MPAVASAWPRRRAAFWDEHAAGVRAYMQDVTDPLLAEIVERFLAGDAGRIRGPRYALLDILRAMASEMGTPGVPRPSPATSGLARRRSAAPKPVGSTLAAPASVVAPPVSSAMAAMGPDVRKGQLYAIKPILSRALAHMVGERPDQPLSWLYHFSQAGMVIEAAILIQREHRAKQRRSMLTGFGASFCGPGEFTAASARAALSPDGEGDEDASRSAEHRARSPHRSLAGAGHVVRVSGRSRHKWILHWADEFDYTGLPDRNRWSFQTNCNAWIHGPSHGEKQWYTADRHENASVGGGSLKITARREPWGDGGQYTSARLHTQGKLELTYGRVEVCAKLPPWQRGLWPAIWMLPARSEYGKWPASGEIDLVEAVGWHPSGTLHHSVHTGKFNHRSRTQSTAKSVLDEEAVGGFHTYGLEWTPDALLLFVDDSTHHIFRRRKGASPAEWPFDKPFFLLLNLAVGGNWGGKHGIDDSAFPATMEVRSVRVFKRVRAARTVGAVDTSSGGEEVAADLWPEEPQPNLASSASRGTSSPGGRIAPRGRADEAKGPLQKRR